jgi:hypothetical protein
MLKKFGRSLILMGLLTSLFAIMASAATASTWHTNKGVGGYSGAFTGTSGAGTLTGPTAALSCTGSTATGTIGGPTFSGATWSGAATGTVAYTGCTVGGQAATVSCSITLNATSYSGPTSSPALSGVTSGNLAAACTVVRLGVQVCTITGTAVPGSFTNASTAGGLDSRLTIPAVTRAGGQLVTANGSGGACPVGVGTAALTANTYTSTNTTQPIVWFTNP